MVFSCFANFVCAFQHPARMQRAPGLRAGEKKTECEYPNGHMDHFGDEISVVLHAKQLNVMPHFYSPQHTRISIYMAMVWV